MDFWAQFIFKMVLIVALSFGLLLISIFPVIRKVSSGFAAFSLVSGFLVIFLLLYFLFGNPVHRGQFFTYGLSF